MVAIMGGIGPRIARANGYLYLIDPFKRLTKEHAATLMRVGFFAMLAQLV